MSLCNIFAIIGRTVPLLKPTRAHTVILGRLTSQKIPPTPHPHPTPPPPPPPHPHTPPLATRGKPGLIALIGPLRPYCSQSPLILLRYVTEIKFCSKAALTWKLTLVLAFPAHCIWNQKLNGISRTNVSKVTLNATLQVHDGHPLLGQGVGENVQWSMKARFGNRCRGDLPMASHFISI